MDDFNQSLKFDDLFKDVLSSLPLDKQIKVMSLKTSKVVILIYILFTINKSLFHLKEFEVFLSVLQAILTTKTDQDSNDKSMQFDSSERCSSLLNHLSDDRTTEHLQCQVRFP